MIQSKALGILSRIISATPLGLWTVRVRAGLACGAKWTLLPFSAYWRYGETEQDVTTAASYYQSLNGLVFWDFGAHFGIHTVGMAMHVGPNGQVVAFEPDPAAFSRLSYHVRLNDLPNVRLFQAAASRSSGYASLYLPSGQGSAVSHLRYNPADKMTKTRSISVSTIAADDLVASGQIRLPQIVKIDVQGHGAEAVAGAINSIKTSLPIIAFSNHSEAELSGIQALLEPLSYKPINFDGTHCRWRDFTEALLVPATLML